MYQVIDALKSSVYYDYCVCMPLVCLSLCDGEGRSKLAKPDSSFANYEYIFSKINYGKYFQITTHITDYYPFANMS